MKRSTLFVFVASLLVLVTIDEVVGGKKHHNIIILGGHHGHNIMRSGGKHGGDIMIWRRKRSVAPEVDSTVLETEYLPTTIEIGNPDQN